MTTNITTTTATPPSDLQRLRHYFRNIVKPIEDRTEVNLIIAGLMRTTIAVLAGKPLDHDRLAVDSALAWFFFDREAARWGSPGWTKENRALVRALELCATALQSTAGPAESLDADEFERLFRQSYPAVKAVTARRLASDVDHLGKTADLIVAELEHKIGDLEAARRKTSL